MSDVVQVSVDDIELPLVGGDAPTGVLTPLESIRAVAARVPQDAIVMGEIALSGEVRPIAHAALRLKEAAKLGFENAWVPGGTDGPGGLKIERYGNLRQLVDGLLGR